MLRSIYPSLSPVLRRLPIILICSLLVLLTGIVIPVAAQSRQTGPILTVDFATAQYPISPYIYGMNFGDADLVAELQIPVRRWGGNATTRYNWQLDAYNTGSDWYFENIPNENDHPENLPNGSASDKFVEENLANNTESFIAIPTIGWTAKARKDHPFDCGFKISKYGQQDGNDWEWDPDCGNGILYYDENDNPVFLTGNDPTDTSIEVDETFEQAWIQHLIDNYGDAANGGVKFYNLDNEPFLWNETHRDIYPDPLSYDEIRDRAYLYAAAIKATDPTAQILGPAEWGWTGYFYSALDRAPGGDWWNNPLDRLAHGDIPFIEWYLQQMQAYETAHGVRLLDYVDEHFYQENGVSLNEDDSSATAALRLRSTRSLWDPTYVDESWIGEPIYMIPRMHQWVADNYPGTKIAIGEYNWGALTKLNGALAQADVLGIFGREQLDLATLWDPPHLSDPGAFAFRMYLNYDGSHSKFGDISVSAVSDNQAKLAVYAAHRTLDNALTLMIINKTGNDFTSAVNLTGFTPAPLASVYRYSGADLSAIQHLSDQAMTATGFSGNFPANSITLVVIPAGGGEATEVLVNGGFEDAGATSGEALNWTAKDLVKDKRKCNKDGKPPVAHSGTCAFQFTGTLGFNSNISQSVDPAGINAGDTLSLTAWIRGKNITAGGKVMAKVNFGDGSKTKIKFAISPGSYDYTQSIQAKSLTGIPSSVKVVVAMTNGGGKFIIDDASLGVTAAARTVSSGTESVLPLPGADQGAALSTRQ